MTNDNDFVNEWCEPVALRILCVDDNRELADSYQMLLCMTGFDVEVCYDGASAIRIASTFKPHVCILDLNMPGMAGDEVAKRILAMTDGVAPFMIAATAMAGDLYRVLTKASGFDIHLVKPIDPRELIEVIESRMFVPGDCEISSARETNADMPLFWHDLCEFDSHNAG